MRTNRRTRGFTLIEVLIVVVIMAVLAATIIPQFTASTTDAKESALKYNMHMMRSQIELYKIHHLGQYPTIGNDADGKPSLPQLTAKTNSDGTVDASGEFGPYIQSELPENPFNNSREVVAVATAGAKPAAVVAGDAGWQYDVSNGTIWPNNSEYFKK